MKPGMRRQIAKEESKRKIEKKNIREALGCSGKARNLKYSPYQSPDVVKIKGRCGYASLKSKRNKLDISKNYSKKAAKVPIQLPVGKKLGKVAEYKEDQDLFKNKEKYSKTIGKIEFDYSGDENRNQIFLTPRSSLSISLDDSLIVSGTLVISDNAQFQTSSSIQINQPKSSCVDGENLNQFFTEELMKKLARL